MSSPVKTRAHDWPAWVKLGALCIATLLLFRVQSHAVAAASLLATGGLYALPGLRFLRIGIARMAFMWPFVAVIAVWHLATGTIADGAVILMRLLTAVALANLVTMTTKLTDMVGVIRWLASPLRAVGLQTKALELAIALVIRFIPVLIEKGQGLTMAWRARSFRRANWRLVLPFTLLALDDAEHVAEALRARGGATPNTET